MPNRADFQNLAEARLREANALLAAGEWSGAYYLAGYAVECGLKACILARIERDGVIFDNKDGKKLLEDCWSHDPRKLRGLADLDKAFGAAVQMMPEIGPNWDVAIRWSESSRYRVVSEVEAKELILSVGDPTFGVLSWVRKHW